MPEWLYEAGIGEARAALVDNGEIIEALIETDAKVWRCGTIADAQLTDILISSRRGVARLGDGAEALVEPLSRDWTKGARIRIEIVREAMSEPGNPKRMKARPASDGTLQDGPDLKARIAATDFAVVECSPHGEDRLEAAGWSEVLATAQTGRVDFDGGTVLIEPTAAMTVIDVDGYLPPAALALAAAQAAALAIRRFGIAGSIGIDFPTLGNREERIATAERFDAFLPQPFERTAINGFGLMQVIRPRLRASLNEQLRADPAGHAARALLRRTERSGLVGATRLVAAPPVIAVLESRADWLERLSRHLGGSVGLRADTARPIWSGYEERA
ncbi:MAG: ribonuclease E/G [Sphingomonadales bacterium]